MIQEIQQLEKQIQTWKNLSMFQDFSNQIAEAEAKIEEMKQHKDINIVILETETIETEEIEETKADTIDDDKIDDDKIDDDNNERIWLVPMNTSFVDCGKKDKNYMDYKALALFMYFSKRKSEEVCEMLGLDISEVEEHRFLYDNFINENIEKFEELSDWKKQNIRKQINKLTKAGNKVISADYTESGELYYKIMPYVDKNNQLKKDGTFVTIESDILRFLINATNSNVIKIYCFLKWFLIDQEYYNKTKEVRYIEKQIDREFICKQIGLSSKSDKTLKSISRDIEDLLVMTHLIERRAVTKREFGQTKTVYYYSLVDHDEWKSYRDYVRKHGIKK